MTKLEMLTKSADFFIAESARLLEQDKKCKTEKEKKASYLKLVSLKSKIIFEIAEINRIMDESGEADESGDDWKKA